MKSVTEHLQRFNFWFPLEVLEPYVLYNPDFDQNRYQNL